MMTRVFRAAILIALVFSAKGAFAATTHYISKSLGADTNNGTSKTTPWAHLPGMPSCTASCATYSPVAGDQFILRGGDTWTASDLGVNWQWGGTSGAHIYIGVDLTWFTGASWTRPIFNCQSTPCTNTNTFGSQIWVSASYVTVDNIEFTGLRETVGNDQLKGVSSISDHTEVENCYFHGWSRVSTGINDNGSTAALALNLSNGDAGVVGANFHNNVIDGSDSPNQDMMVGVLHGDTVANNVIRYVYNGMNGVFRNVHGNRVEHNFNSYTGDHCNLIFIQSALGGAGVSAYNNVIDNLNGCSGGSTLWIIGNDSCAGCTSYVYNNAIYDTSVGFDSQGVAIGGHASTGNIGTVYVYNNTIEPGGSCMGSGDTGGSILATVHYANNHCITSEGICLNTAVTCVNDGTNLFQSLAAANSAGYNDAQTYAFSPTSSGSPTVGKGTDYASMCSGSAAALCSDTTYATYNTTNHTVAMRTVVPRPSSGAWDIGAYQYSSSQAQAPQPPVGLQATVQ
jgi:hypothetical protein